MAKMEKPRVTVTCIDCGCEYTVSVYHFKNYSHQGKPFRCQPCYKKWRKEEWYKNMDPKKKAEMSAKRSGISKSIWENMDPNKKVDAHKKMAETRKNRTDEEKAATREKTRNTWKSKSPEEMAEHSRIRSINTKAFWDSLSKEEYDNLCAKMSESQRAYFDNLTEEERRIRAKILRESSQDYWNNLPEEEYQLRILEMSENRKSEWNNASPEEIAQRIHAISEGRKRYWEKLSPEEKAEIGKQHSEWWKGLSREAFQKSCYEVAIESNANKNTNISDGNRNELVILNELRIRGFDFNTQYYNTIKHNDFDKLFPRHPESNSVLINPYHPWDFVIHTHDGDVLLDVDGSIHSIGPFIENKIFSDSKRPYQTDGLPAYAILAYDDNITSSTPVLNISTGEKMDLKTFLNIISFMDMANEEKREIMKHDTP